MIISNDGGFSEMVVRKLHTSEFRTLKAPQNIGMEVRYRENFMCIQTDVYTHKQNEIRFWSEQSRI